MFRALYTASSGMTAQQLNLDNIANNLANSSTTGFQQRQVNFTDLLYQSEIMPGSAATADYRGGGFTDRARNKARPD
jgi:flagellar basal-body rod protein FlgG